MQSNNEKCAANQKMKGRLRKVKKHTRKTRQLPVSHLDLDLETPNSVLVHADLKLLVNPKTFATLSLDRRTQLLRMLPECDQVSGPDKELRLSEALNNEFFAKACTDWKRKLAEGKFTPESQLLAKMEHEREQSRMDPWKLKHYEPYWGHKDPLNVPPADKVWVLSPMNSVGSDIEDTTNCQLSTTSTFTESHESPMVDSNRLSHSIDPSQVLSALLRLNSVPVLPTSTCSPSSVPSSTSALSFCPSVVAYSSQNFAVASTVLPAPRIGNMSSCNLDRFISNGSSLSSPRSSCSASATTTAAGSYCGSSTPLASVSQSTLPRPAVMFLTMPFLNRGTSAIVPTLPALSTTLLHTADKVVERSNAPSQQPPVLPSGGLPPAFQLRFSLPSNVSQNVALSDGIRKRMLDGATHSDPQQPDCKRSLLTSPVLCTQGLPGTSKTFDAFNGNIVLSRSIASQPAVSNAPIFSTIVNGHQSGSVPSLTAIPSQHVSSTVPGPTRLFSIPVQGMPGQPTCPVVFMLPQTGPRNGTAVTQSTTTSKFVYLISPPRPTYSSSPGGTAAAIFAGASSKCEPQMTSNVVLPGLNGSRLQGIANSTLAVTSITVPLNGIFNGVGIVRSSSQLLAAPHNPERFYGVSLLSTAPVVNRLCSKPPMVSNTSWPVRITNTSDVRTMQPISIPPPSNAVLRFASNGERIVSSLPSIRFIPNVPVSSSPVPLFVEQLIAGSMGSRTTFSSTMQSTSTSYSAHASTIRSPPFHTGIHVPVRSTLSGALPTAAMLPAFPSQMTTVLQRPVLGPGSGILRTLLSRSTTPSLIQSPAESISRSLSHLYTINASNCTTINSLAARLLGRGVNHAVVDSTRLVRPVSADSGGNKCGKCGAPCLLLDGAGQSRLCITCLIMA